MRTRSISVMYISAIVVVGGWLLAASLGRVLKTDLGIEALAWALLALTTLVAGRFNVRLPFLGCRVSISDAFIFLAVLLFGADLAALTGALDGYAASARQKGTWYKRLFNTAGMAMSVYLSARLFEVALQAGSASSGSWFPLAGLLLPVLFLGVSQFVINTAMVSIVVWLSDGVAVGTVWRSALRWTGTAYLAGAVAAAVVFIIVRQAGIVSCLAIFPFPALLYATYQVAAARMQARRVPIRN